PRNVRMAEPRQNLPFLPESLAKQASHERHINQFYRHLLIELPVHPARQVDGSRAAAPEQSFQFVRASAPADVPLLEFPWFRAHKGSGDSFFLINRTQQGTCLVQQVAISRTERFETRGPLLTGSRARFVDNRFQAAPAFRTCIFRGQSATPTRNCFLKDCVNCQPNDSGLPTWALRFPDDAAVQPTLRKPHLAVHGGF